MDIFDLNDSPFIASGPVDTKLVLPALTPHASAAKRTQRTILIIEENPLTGELYRTKFERAGYVVEVISDGQSGYYRVMEWRPSILLLDLSLPTLDGIEILKKVRAQRVFDHMIILALTYNFVSEMTLEALRNGAFEVLEKSTTTPNQLVQAAERALRVPDR